MPWRLVEVPRAMEAITGIRKGLLTAQLTPTVWQAARIVGSDVVDAGESAALRACVFSACVPVRSRVRACVRACTYIFYRKITTY